MQVTFCDWCRPQTIKAEFRVEFHRIDGRPMPDGDTSSDVAVDLCRKHYDAIFTIKEKYNATAAS